MNIDKDIVLHIAKLAHLELGDHEVEAFTKQLGDILHYIEKLNEMKQPAEPFSFSRFLPSVARADGVLPSLNVDEALKNAPERVKQFFKVPRILP